MLTTWSFETLDSVFIGLIKKALRGVKVEVLHCGTMRRKYRVCGITSQATRELTFPVDESGIVKPFVEYFRETYDFTLKQTQWPCLQIGRPQRPNYLPMEVCKIVEGQRYSKRYARCTRSVSIGTMSLLKQPITDDSRSQTFQTKVNVDFPSKKEVELVWIKTALKLYVPAARYERGEQNFQGKGRARSPRILVQDGVHPSTLHSSKDRVHPRALHSSSKDWVNPSARAVVVVYQVVSMGDSYLLLVELLGHQFLSCTKQPWLHIKQG